MKWRKKRRKRKRRRSAGGKRKKIKWRSKTICPYLALLPFPVELMTRYFRGLFGLG